jgi:hypothetical protein
MNDSAQWWYARGGQQVGPVPFATLQELATGGELMRSSLVWTTGMSAWAPASSVAELRWPETPARPGGQPPPLETTAVPPPLPAPPFALPAPAPGSHWSPPAATTAAGAVAEPEALNVTTTVLLAVVTFGIFGAIRFYQTARAYERLAGRETRFTLYFWIWVACVVAAWPLGMHFVLVPAGLVFQFLTLGEALRARREALERWQLAPAVASENTHWLYLALGVLLSPIVIGLVFLVLQAVKWFDDWNAIRAAAIARG